MWEMWGEGVTSRDRSRRFRGKVAVGSLAPRTAGASRRDVQPTRSSSQEVATQLPSWVALMTPGTRTWGAEVKATSTPGRSAGRGMRRQVASYLINRRQLSIARACEASRRGARKATSSELSWSLPKPT